MFLNETEQTNQTDKTEEIDERLRRISFMR